VAINKVLQTFSGALTAGTFTGSVVQDCDGFTALAMVLAISSTSGGTSPTIQPNLQTSADGVNWGNLPATFWNGAALPAALSLSNGATQYSFLAVGASLALALVRAVWTVVSTPTVTGTIQLLAR
jgi:hypothetical protein